ncbi:MAG: hypothetical protein JNK47_04740 [Mesorhizobium sp.]|nr:hypothetical protein [Mesorhizobium sp.]MBL8576511.1 hypothetical protein [Mesorhizobium sp.]
MADQIEFDERVRDHIWTILSRKYNTVRQGGHPVDADEHLRERTFWPDMRFHKVDAVDGPNGRQLQLTFTPANRPDATFGYKIDVDKAASAWSERVGIREPRENSSMFAAELIWYMVAYIGSTDIDSCVEDGHGVRWINTGSDVFKPLPDPDAHHH